MVSIAVAKKLGLAKLCLYCHRPPSYNIEQTQLDLAYQLNCFTSCTPCYFLPAAAMLMPKPYNYSEHLFDSFLQVGSGFVVSFQGHYITSRAHCAQA
jgi:hypothetical protein